MRIYFLSSIPAALYVGGAYFGHISDFERFAEINLQDGLPVRIEAEGQQPLHFSLTERLPLSPPQGVDVYRLERGLALYAHGFVSTDNDFKLITQNKQGDFLATVAKQGGVILTMESADGFFTAHLPASFCVCQLIFIGNFLLVKGREALAVFSRKAELLLSERYLTADVIGNELHFTAPLSDHYKRVAQVTYRAEEEGLIKISHSVKQSDDKPVESLLAYAFFESVRIGGNFQDFLCEELSENQENIRSFLGNFSHVIPTDSPTECLLVFPISQQLFDVRKYKVVIENGKIHDVSG